ncbi:5-carboxymethyl-2-hydroxymuconate isomerase [Hylemonella gracilis str. Niagara R]|uniref:5-carboxymethyl-2-hydroxymuconate isomerase n=1 Tax=Hylemonella gracilis str. Niagara R TaxID=1458275 RepID=A0A016XHM7_9BURK|nr:fumarylacetoacetate hydrolase family protein [Hylemonella gracilis]EYC51574.1 5-carboxymethyl-2-hydroxymuconate isomerase [Hylemonella gracilis str. Niagara R]
MPYVIPAPAPVSVPVVGRAERFAVNRVYCVGRNYVAHAQEMGYTGREPPFFFIKPADSCLVVEPGQTAQLPYPSLTQDFQHEIELVACIGQGGMNIPAAEARQHIWGYAVGLDMTRRDLQGEQKKLGRPWCIGKTFEAACPIGAITPAATVAAQIESAEIALTVNGQPRQHSDVSKLIWNLGEIIEHLSRAWLLKPGDLIYTGTPEGVAAVRPGDLLEGHVGGLTPIRLQVV